MAAVALLALLALAATIPPWDAAAQQGLSIGVDADPAGNTATSLDSIEPCVQVGNGDTFQIDIFVTGVDDLTAWEVYFSFDGDVVNVTDRDVEMFQAAGEGSSVFDASDVLPSSGGLYRVGAVDLSQPPVPESGSGVLARLTLEAVGAGLSPAILTTIDADNDGKIDIGPQLSDAELKPLGDANGDGFFDGPFLGAQIAVGRDCPAGPESTPVLTVAPPATSPTQGATPVTTATAERPSPTSSVTATAPIASPTPSSNEDGGTDWTSGGLIAAYVVAGLAGALLVSGGAFLAINRRRSP